MSLSPAFRPVYYLTLTLGFFVLSQHLGAQKLEGMASFYGDKFHGRPTSTGETFDKTGFTAASLDLDWGTVVEVTNLANGKTVQVRVNDCGPHAKGRIIDLTRAAAEELDFIKDGEAKVRLRVIQPSTSGPTCKRGAWAKGLKAQGKSIPPPPAPWDPTQTMAIEPANPVVPGPTASPRNPVPTGSIQGLASFYADRFQGRPTSTGEVYDRNKFTAASKAFPYGTLLEVTNLVSGAKTEVRVNDCGPHSADRILDLSRVAAERIGLVQAGTGMVTLRVLKLGEDGPTCNRSAWLRAKSANPATVSTPYGAGSRPSPSSPRPVGEMNTDRGSAPVTRPVPRPAAAEPAQPMVQAYAVQVGAFGKKANAQQVIVDLLAAGFPDSYSAKERNLHKVFTAVARTEEEATAALAGLAEVGYENAKVVSRSVPQNLFPDAAPTPEPGPATYGQVAVMSPEAAPAPPAEEEFAPDEMLFGVKIGSYGTPQAAAKVMDKLTAAGYRPVYSFDVGKAVRVFVGKFYFQSQANELKAELRAKGHPTATVRRVQ